MIPDIATWAQSTAGFYLQETKRPIKLAPHQVDILRHVFTPDHDGKMPYETILLSSPKKSGKTTVAAMAALWWALFVQPPDEIIFAANSLDQSTSRSFRDMKMSIRNNPILKPATNIKHKEIVLDNGSLISAVSTDYAGVAGSRHGLTVFDELWAFETETSRRLYDELTPVPTRQNSVRLIVSYAGFEGVSELLEGLYKQHKAADPVPALMHILNGRDEPACRADGRTFTYWDHELKPHEGLSVSPAAYHEQQRKDLRPAAYARLHLNEFVSSISSFVSKEQWQECYSPIVQPITPADGRKMILGVDASTTRDLTALVGVTRHRDGTTHVVYVKSWKPTKGSLRSGKPTIDLNLVADEILRLHGQKQVSACVYDPFQFHSLAIQLEQAGVKMLEFPQTNARVASDTALYDAIIGKTIKHANHPELNEHVANAVAKEGTRGLRLAKEKTSRKIDLVVALSMAAYHLQHVGVPVAIPAQPMQQSRWQHSHKPGWSRVGRTNGQRWRNY